MAVRTKKVIRNPFVPAFWVAIGFFGWVSLAQAQSYGPPAGGETTVTPPYGGTVTTDPYGNVTATPYPAPATPGGVPVAPGGAPTGAAAPNAGTTVVVVQGAPATTRPVDPDPVRVRFGVALGGELLVAPSSGLVGLGIGLTFRLGVQFNQWFGLYYQPHGLVGGWATQGAAGVIAALYNSMLFEVTLPFVHIGAGPSFDVLGVAGCGDFGGAVGCLSDDAAFFGLDGRFAIVLGAIGRGSRGGFSINAHAHPTFVGSNVLLTFTLGLGGEVY